MFIFVAAGWTHIYPCFNWFIFFFEFIIFFLKFWASGIALNWRLKQSWCAIYYWVCLYMFVTDKQNRLVSIFQGPRRRPWGSGVASPCRSTCWQLTSQMIFCIRIRATTASSRSLECRCLFWHANGVFLVSAYKQRTVVLLLYVPCERRAKKVFDSKSWAFKHAFEHISVVWKDNFFFFIVVVIVICLYLMLDSVCLSVFLISTGSNYSNKQCLRAYLSTIIGLPGGRHIRSLAAMRLEHLQNIAEPLSKTVVKKSRSQNWSKAILKSRNTNLYLNNIIPHLVCWLFKYNTNQRRGEGI